MSRIHSLVEVEDIYLDALGFRGHVCGGDQMLVHPMIGLDWRTVSGGCGIEVMRMIRRSSAIMEKAGIATRNLGCEAR